MKATVQSGKSQRRGKRVVKDDVRERCFKLWHERKTNSRKGGPETQKKYFGEEPSGLEGSGEEGNVLIVHKRASGGATFTDREGPSRNQRTSLYLGGEGEMLLRSKRKL